MSDNLPEKQLDTPTVATEQSEPQTVDEAKWLNDGFKAGLTAYAREVGHSTLRSDNELLRRLMDEHGWKTIEAFERITGRRI